jgi:putative transposase
MEKKTYPVTVLCKVMQVSRSAFYAWLKNTEKSKSCKINFDNTLKEVFLENRQVYGQRRLKIALKNKGLIAGRYKIRQALKRMALQVRYPKRYQVTTNSNHDERISDNVLNRNFTPDAPNQVWTTDITYVWTLEGWLYVAIVMDLFSRRVVGWAIDKSMKTELCVKALQMAFWQRRPPPDLLHHSDRGSQYASREYRQHLAVMGMRQSMSRKGNCWDNAPTERFFRSMKYEQLNYERFSSQKVAKLAIIDYLAFYNGRRLNSILGYQSPLQFENNLSL